MVTSLWTIEEGDSPILATALHAGHKLRDELKPLFAFDEMTQMMEEDRYTDCWTSIAPNRIMPRHSRFEVDLNRPRNKCVYLVPSDDWGHEIWKRPLTPEMIARSVAEYDDFYKVLKRILERIIKRHGKAVVYELHTYNYRRPGPDVSPEDSEKNPDINLGTRTLNRNYWVPLIDRFIHDLSAYDFPGRRLDVRENIKFVGREFPRWVHSQYPEQVCVLSIEVKKIFMDEWTGDLNQQLFEGIHKALASTIPGVLDELKRLGAVNILP